MKTIYVILPCYNEEQNIEKLVALWKKEEEYLSKAGFSLIILPIDDASKDGTKEIISRLSGKYENVASIYHEENKGLGGALRSGFEYFNTNGSSRDYCVVMDGDNTHKPKYIRGMIKLIEKSDGRIGCVIASRYKKGSKASGLPAFRSFLSFGARMYYTVLLGVPGVRDYTCGYRLYAHGAISKGLAAYEDKFPEERGFSCMMEVLYKLHLIGVRFSEVPFDLRYGDKGGESKMKIAGTVRDSLLKTLELKFMTGKKRTNER